MKEFWQRITGWCLVILTFLLPLKLGSLAMMPEQPSMFPGDLITMLVISWPPHLTGVAGGVLLAASVLLFPAPNWRSPGGLAALFWGIGLPLASLPGIINGSNADYVWSAVAHWFGIGSVILSAWWIFSSSAVWKKLCLAALAASTLLAGADAWRQYLWGFEEMEEMIRKQRESGMEISNIMEIRIRDGRIFGTLGSCNTLAGFLLFSAPLALTLLWKCGKYFEPVKVSRVLFSGIGAVLLIAPMLMTRSRGAWLCAGGAAFLWFICRKNVKKHYKILAVFCCAAALAAGAVLVCRSGRGILSGVERLDYVRSAVIMCGEHPVAGGGWGEFFHRHMKLKLSSSDESARSPHNLPLQFACHAGIPAGLMVLAAMVLLIAGLFKNRSDDPVFQAGTWGILAFLCHCMMEINDSIPASMSCCVLAALALLPDSESASEEPRWSKILSITAALLVAATAFYTNFQWLRGEAAFEQLELALRPKMDDGKVTAPDPYVVMQRLEQVAQLRPRSPYPFEMTGDLVLRCGEFETAEKLFEKSRSLAPGRPSVYRRLAAVAFRRGEIETARKYLAAAKELFPADPKNDWKNFEGMMTAR